MADNITAPGAGVVFASDDVSGVQYPRVKFDGGTDGVSTPITAGRKAAALSLPFTLSDEDFAALDGLEAGQAASNVLLGSVTETAPASDTASSGINGRLQRIAQRLTSLITAIGSPFQAGGSIGNTAFGISGTLPAFAATPTFNLGTLNGAATAAAQTTGNASLASIDGKLTLLPANLTQIGGTAVATGAGTANSGTQRVAIASDQTAVPVSFSNGQFSTATATIASGANTSGIVDLGTNRLFGIVMPSAWTAADIAFQASIDGTNFFDVFTDDSARLYVFTDGYTTGGRFIPLINPSIFLAIRYLRIVSRTTSATVNQAASRDVTLVTMP